MPCWETKQRFTPRTQALRQVLLCCPCLPDAGVFQADASGHLDHSSCGLRKNCASLSLRQDPHEGKALTQGGKQNKTKKSIVKGSGIQVDLPFKPLLDLDFQHFSKSVSHTYNGALGVGTLSVRPVLTLEKAMNPPAGYHDSFPQPTKEQSSPSPLLSTLLLDLPKAPTSEGIKPQPLVWHSRPSTILCISLPSPFPHNSTKRIGL